MLLFQLAFPAVVWALASAHYAMTSRDFGKQAMTRILLSWILVCFSCIVSLVFSLRGESWKRTAGVVLSMVAGALKLSFLVLSSLV